MTDNLVYHYTNTAGLLGIIKSRKLWASDIQFLNDAMEIKYGVSVIIDKIHPKNKKEEENRRRLKDELTRTARPTPDDPTWHLYAACFCGNGDLLSQWRTYGRDGYAIGFQREWLLSIAEKFNVSEPKGDAKIFGEVHYENGDTHASGLPTKIRGLLKGGDTDTSELSTKIRELLKDFENSKKRRETMGEVILEAAMIKHKTFEAEDERRLLLPSYGLRSDLEFRSGVLGVVPYREVRFAPSDIVEVHVGPGHSSRERSNSVDHLLESKGFRHVRVRSSESPVRVGV